MKVETTIVFHLDNFFIPKGLIFFPIVKFSLGNIAIGVFLFFDKDEHGLFQGKGHADT